MTKPNDVEPYSTPVEKLLELRNSELINGMSTEDLKDLLVISRYHITLLESILTEIRKPQSRGGKTRGINKDTGESIFEKGRRHAAVWMLEQFSGNSQRTFSFLERRFEQKTQLPFNNNNLHDAWKNWNEVLNDEQKQKLLADLEYVRQILIE
jgi:hypothetical protein